VIQDAVAYQKLVDELEDAKTRTAVEQAQRGEGLPLKEAFALIRKRAQQRRAK
jgi:hypothetical protein